MSSPNLSNITSSIYEALAQIPDWDVSQNFQVPGSDDRLDIYISQPFRAYIEVKIGPEHSGAIDEQFGERANRVNPSFQDFISPFLVHVVPTKSSTGKANRMTWIRGFINKNSRRRRSPVGYFAIDIYWNGSDQSMSTQFAAQFAETFSTEFRNAYVPIGFTFYNYIVKSFSDAAALPVGEEPTRKYRQRLKEVVETEAIDPKFETSSTVPFEHHEVAIRAVLQSVRSGQNRVLLMIPPGFGKMWMTEQLITSMSAPHSAKRLLKALFVCNDGEVQSFAVAMFNEKRRAAIATEDNPHKDAKVIIATYETLSVNTANDDSTYLNNHYPGNYFSHIIIQEAADNTRRQWSTVLKHYPDAVHIGITGTPSPEIMDYFGKPVFAYAYEKPLQSVFSSFRNILDPDVYQNLKREITAFEEEYASEHYAACATRIGRTIEFTLYCLSDAWGVLVNKHSLEMVDKVQKALDKVRESYIDLTNASSDHKRPQLHDKAMSDIGELSTKTLALVDKMNLDLGPQEIDSPPETNAILDSIKREYGEGGTSSHKSVRDEVQALKAKNSPLWVIKNTRNRASHADWSGQFREVAKPEIDEMMEQVRIVLHKLVNIGEAIRIQNKSEAT